MIDIDLIKSSIKNVIYAIIKDALKINLSEVIVQHLQQLFLRV